MGKYTTLKGEFGDDFSRFEEAVIRTGAANRIADYFEAQSKKFDRISNLQNMTQMTEEQIAREVWASWKLAYFAAGLAKVFRGEL